MSRAAFERPKRGSEKTNPSSNTIYQAISTELMLEAPNVALETPNLNPDGSPYELRCPQYPEVLSPCDCGSGISKVRCGPGRTYEPPSAAVLCVA